VPPSNPVSTYLSDVKRRYSSGHAREHAYRPAFQRLIEDLVPDVNAINDPRQSDFGAPDFIVRRGDITVGHVEAKDLDVALDTQRESEQLTRYRQHTENLVLTNYLDFELFRDGQLILTASAGRLVNKKIQLSTQGIADVSALMGEFLSFAGVTIRSAKMLAEIMAKKARLVKIEITRALNSHSDDESLPDQLDAFRRYLIHDLTIEEFADLYAQTIAYGLFAARLHDPSPSSFSRTESLRLIPRSHPFLRKLFGYVAGPELDERIVWAIDSLAEVFARADLKALLTEYGVQTPRNDPLIHFYEPFLSSYDPRLRIARGVWYTPAPVVNFIVRAVDDVLQSHFSLDGLSDASMVTVERRQQNPRTKRGFSMVKEHIPRVQVLDPAAGTGTFLAEVVRLIHESTDPILGSAWSKYVEDSLLKRIHGFEILMASYVMSHIKMELLLNETGYSPDTQSPRFSMFLTNSLEPGDEETDTLFGFMDRWLAEESVEASRVKNATPIMVVLGNPPYSGNSMNKGKWITSLIDDYKYIDGEHFGERKHWLGDDYVKFIRVAEAMIARTGTGVLAMITNHGYLDNLSLRGMRHHLASTFDHIYIIDLHGNKTRHEAVPNNAFDANVFDIKQGVAIIVAVKTGDNGPSLAEVKVHDIWGSREDKYEFLLAANLDTIDWDHVPMMSPEFRFKPTSSPVSDSYAKAESVTDIMTIGTSGIQTSRDDLVVAFEEAELLTRIATFTDSDLSDNEVRQLFFSNRSGVKYPPGDSRGWKLPAARIAVGNNTHKDFIMRFAYRPFDWRFLYFDEAMIDWPRTKVMSEFCDHENFGLIVGRQGQAAGGTEWSVAYVTDTISDLNMFYRGGGLVMPLYSYGSDAERLHRLHTLDQDWVDSICGDLSLDWIGDHLDRTDDRQLSPLDCFDYIYGILYCPSYRDRHSDALESGFPRIPRPPNADTLWKVAYYGEQLRQVHLMKKPQLMHGIRPTGKGDWIIERPTFKPKGDIGDVFVNDTQFFSGVPIASWQMTIGGYQPAQKWLKDRRGRKLTLSEIRHFQGIIGALNATRQITDELDIVASSFV